MVFIELYRFTYFLPYTAGLIFHESEAQAVLCKPKLLPLKSFTLEKLEKMQKEATAKAQETILDKQRELETQFYPGTNSGKNKNREYQNINIYIFFVYQNFANI